MVEYNTRQRELIQDLLSSFKSEEITFVIPRGYTDLPNSVPGADIDILVAEQDFEKAKRVTESRGFDTGGDIRETVERAGQLAAQAIQYPEQAKSKLLSEPIDLARMILFDISPSASLRGQYRESKQSQQSVHVHLFNHLAYVSPHNGKKVRVDPSVEKGMLERRRECEEIPASSRSDELAHLICRGVFDKQGEFPAYYLKRCDLLWDQIRGDKEQTVVLRELLSKIFFDADTVVLSAIRNSTYSSLRSELMAYDKY